MPRFSEVLSSYVIDKGISVSTLSKLSGVERTSIYKMMAGERKPPDYSVAEKLADTLLLSSLERENLLTACKIEQMGESVYRRRSAVREFFNSFDPLPPSGDAQPSRIEPPADLAGIRTAYGSMTVYNLIRDLIDLENQRPDARIRVLAQPDRGLLFDYLALLGAKNRQLLVEHVLCFENARSEENGLYNFSCLTKLLPLFAVGCDYRPFYFYDHVPSRFSDTGTLSFFVLTHTHVIAYSCDETKAAVSDDPQILELYRRIFDELRNKSEALTQSFGDPLNLVTYWSDAQNRFSHLENSLAYQPCIVPLMQENVVKKYIDRDLIQTDELVDAVEDYFRSRRDPNWYGAIKHFFFSESSLDEFLADGRVLEIPDELYHPLDLPDRRTLLRRMAEELEMDRYRAVLLKPGALRLSPNLSCGLFSGSVFMDIVVPGQNFVTLVIPEQSIVSTLTDFFEYLPTSDMVYSKDETLTILRRKAGDKE